MNPKYKTLLLCILLVCLLLLGSYLSKETLILLWIFLVCLVLSSIYLSKETFQTKRTILTSQRLNYEDSIANVDWITLPASGWNYVRNQLASQQSMDIYRNPDEIIIDPKDRATYLPKAQKALLPKGYFCIFTSTKKKDDFQCGFDWTNKKIGYFDRIEENMIRTVLYGYRTRAKLEYIQLENLKQLEMLFDQLDVIIVYIIPGSALAKIIAYQDLTLLDLNEIDTERLRITYPELFVERVTVDSIFGTNHRIETMNPTVQLLGTSLYRVRLPKPTIQETFITRLEREDPGEYSCMGDDSRLISKWACESPYDIFGEPKTQPTVWDKPCKKNNDCPFYKANKNYPNTRGKCLETGLCELPTGVMRMSYTKYDDRNEYTPFCYQCQNPTDPNCCKEQEKLVELQKKNSKQTYTNLKSPDYVFSNDTEDRLKYKLPTTIQLS